MTVRDLAQASRRAQRRIIGLNPAIRRDVLLHWGRALGQQQERILAANREDLTEARAAAQRGELSHALVKRLELTPNKLAALSDGLVQLAEAPELVGEVDVHRKLDEGLVLQRVRCPLGVLGVVFESRPDAVPQIAGLAFKSGNGVLLKGGREAGRSNAVLVEVLQEVLRDHQLPPQLVSLLEGRAQVEEMLALEKLVDLVIARGSSAFVRHVMASTNIAVMGHAEGLCHLYLDAVANPAMAARLAVDGKTSYPAACNAIETLLWHPGAAEALDATVRALQEAGVELRGCEATRARHPQLGVAREEDWDTEYGDLILSLRCVSSLDDALAHIEAHGSRHTEVIVTDDPQAAATFMAQVDAADVFHNASSRFADGYRFGLGAEVGISTGKLHARGPVGVEGLLTYRWLLRGQGQVASDYGPDKRAYLHEDIE